MGKWAVLFPGQGSQFAGMGKDFYENSIISKDILEKADSIVDFDLLDIIFNDEDKLNSTLYTQSSILAVSYAIYKEVENKIGKPDYVAGLSLGEYSALVASGVLDFEDGIEIVQKRGLFMYEEGQKTKGKMVAVIGFDKDKLINIVDSYDGEGFVGCANFNCPGQIIISGEINAVDSVVKTLENEGARRMIPLNVSGAFHTPLLDGAANKLQTLLKDYTLNDPKFGFMSNVTGSEVKDGNDVKELLSKQVTNSVLFEDILNNMIKNGVEKFIEVGPGKVLSGFVKKIDRKIETININKYEDLERLE